MKIGVIKLGARITWETDAAVGPGEAISICKALSAGGAEVHVFTKILSKDTQDPSLKWHNILEDVDTTGLNVLLVINGNVNFFGGAEDRAQILNYKLMNEFKGPVVYVMCDPELPLMQIWENVSKKQADPKFKWTGKYTEEEILVKRPVDLFCQPFNVVQTVNNWQKKNGSVPLGKVVHVPLERFPFLNEWLEPNLDAKVDLLYGGTPRGGRRIPNLFKWYVNLPSDLNVEIFGKITKDDFLQHAKLKDQLAAVQNWPAFTGMVKYCDVLPKMNNAIAHLVTGDPSYEVLDLIPQRVAECIAAGNIVFVDANIDKSRRIYPAGSIANEFLYVKTQSELVEKLRLVKLDFNVRKEIYGSMVAAQNFVPADFCKFLVDQLELLWTLHK